MWNGKTVRGGINEKRKSPYTGAENHDESTWTGAGKLACSKEPSGFSGSGKQGGTQADRWEAEDTGYLKKPVERKSMWISKRRWKAMEKRVADLENRVQNLPTKVIDDVVYDLDNCIKKATDLIFHIPEE